METYLRLHLNTKLFQLMTFMNNHVWEAQAPESAINFGSYKPSSKPKADQIVLQQTLLDEAPFQRAEPSEQQRITAELTFLHKYKALSLLTGDLVRSVGLPASAIVFVFVLSLALDLRVCGRTGLRA